MIRLRAPLAALGAALLLAGCADRSSDEKTIRTLVNSFAAERGPRACDLLTHNALVQIYGGEHPERAHEQCVAASKRFTAAKINITNMHFQNDTTAKVNATDPAGTRHYTVTVAKFGKRWRIDGIVRQ